MVEAGLYEHFKGGLYQVSSVARHSESEEQVVVYRALYGDLGWWVRPLSMFSEEIKHEGEIRPRFKRLDLQSGVLEVAYLDIKEGMLSGFLAAMTKASPLIAASPGYISHQLKHCVEQENRLILLAEWLSLEHHTQGFRGSDRYQKWRELLHPFYDSMPEVLHFNNL